MNDYAKQTQSNPIFTKNPEKLARLVRRCPTKPCLLAAFPAVPAPLISYGSCAPCLEIAPPSPPWRAAGDNPAVLALGFYQVGNCDFGIHISLSEK